MLATAAALGSDPYVRVGDLVCQQQSFLKQITATVVRCELQAPKGIGKKAADHVDPVSWFDVVLSDSVLFPEGGGQPCDHGTLTLLESFSAVEAPTLPIRIENVCRRGDTCVMTSPVALPVGAKVLQEVDWQRRLDHMQHHTAQHLLSAIVEREDVLHLPTVSWSLTHPYCFVQLDASSIQNHLDTSPYAKYTTKEKKLSDEILKVIEEKCNTAIATGTRVDCHVFPDKTAYQAEQDRLTTDGVNGNGFRSRDIPDDVSGSIRIITVDGIDSCTCCGTHVTNLAELHVLHLLHQEVKGNMIKLYFITGQRALRLFNAMYTRERQLMVALGGSRPEDLVQVVQRRSKETAETEKRIKKWTVELAVKEAERLLAGLQASGAASAAKPCVVCVRRDDVAMEYFNTIRTALNEAQYDWVVLVAAWVTDISSDAKDVQGQMMITSSVREHLEAVVAQSMAVMTGMKGGVSKMGFRGKGSLKEWDHLVTALQGP